MVQECLGVRAISPGLLALHLQRSDPRHSGQTAALVQDRSTRQPAKTVQSGTGQQEETVETIQDEGLTVAMAAERFGITPDAVLKRIKRGKLVAQRVDGRWRIYLDAIEPGPDSYLDSPRSDKKSGLISDNGSNGHRQDSGQTRQTPASPELVAVLQEEIAFLREEIRRKDQLLAAALQRIPELPATTASSQLSSTPSSQSSSPAAGPRHWWQRLWKRLAPAS